MFSASTRISAAIRYYRSIEQGLCGICCPAVRFGTTIGALLCSCLEYSHEVWEQKSWP